MFDERQLTQKEQEFVADVIWKELFFSIYSEEDTDVMQLVRHYVEEEKFKIDTGVFGEPNKEESRRAASILKKLQVHEEEIL